MRIRFKPRHAIHVEIRYKQKRIIRRTKEKASDCVRAEEVSTLTLVSEIQVPQNREILDYVISEKDPHGRIAL